MNQGLLEKYFNGDCSPSEEEQVIAYLATLRQHEFDQLLEKHSFTQLEEDPKATLSTEKKNDILQAVLETPTTKSRQFRLPRLGAAAAVILLAVASTFYFLAPQQNNIDKQIAALPKDQPILVASANGKKVEIKEEQAIPVYHAPIQPELLKTNIEPTSIEEILVPEGKKLEVKLSDGSTVTLNSGSSLTYPSVFAANERRVKLTGEAFFEVSSNKEHPFIVETNDVNVHVLGTKFNVKNYQETGTTDVVLVEGLVELQEQNQAKSKQLAPNQKATYSRTQQELTIDDVSNTSYDTAWLKQELFFRNLSFEQICTELERTYAITINLENNKLKNTMVNASFESNESLLEVVRYLSQLLDFEYTVENKSLIIK